MTQHTPEEMTTAQRTELIATISRVFSPSAPINKSDLFAGRLREMERVFEAVNTRGQHAIIFGERGVGKTSLANIVLEIANDTDGEFAVKVNCSQGDDFKSMWKKVLGDVEFEAGDDRATFGFLSKPKDTFINASDWLPEDPSPDDIRRIVRRLGKSIFIFDEFDRIQDGHALFADTIKTLSDASEDCTIVIVGVADDIDALLAEHGSVDRALIQILMPRMREDELREILRKGIDALHMTMDEEVRNLIVLLSQGLPYYTHILGKSAATRAITDLRWHISIEDINESIKSAIQDAQQKIQASYQAATVSPRRDSLFRQVLLACALADVDGMGFFASADVRDPLSKIMHKPYDIPNFSPHLDKFCSANRGNVLEKTGVQRRFRFRFSNPLLQPFVIMRGIADDMLGGQWADILRKQKKD